MLPICFENQIYKLNKKNMLQFKILVEDTIIVT